MKNSVYCDDPRFYSEQEHTADCALKIIAPSLPALFAHAAFGMRTLLFERVDPVVTGKRRIEINEPSAELALVSWLTELNFLITDTRLLFTQIRFLNFDQLNDGLHIISEIDTAPAERCLELLRMEIKAVTLHGLRIIKIEEQFEATVVFDI